MAKSEAHGPSAEDMKSWEAESDLRTLIEAEKIKGDKVRLKAALAKRDEQVKALDKLEAKK